MVGQVSSTLITSIAIILVARFLGSTDYGQYTIVMIPISIATMFTDLGINNGLIKYIAQFRSERKQGNVKNLIKIGLLINGVAGFILTLIIYIFSSYIAINLFKQAEIATFIRIASINLLAQSLFATSRSIIVGFERMEFLSFLTILQSLLKSLLSPILVYLGYGTLGAVVGHSAALTFAGVCGFILVLAVLYRGIQEIPEVSFYDSIKLLTSFGVPLFFSSILSVTLSQALNFLMAIHINSFNIGNYKAALNFTVLVTFFSMPVATVLFPLFSKIRDEDRANLELVYQNSVKYISLIIVPIVGGLILFSEPIVQIVYGTSYPYTASFLRLTNINMLFFLVGAQVTSNVLNSKGKTQVLLRSSLINLCVGIPCGLYLIPKYGVLGLIVTTIISSKTGLLHNLWWVRKDLGIMFDWRASLKIFLSASVSFSAVYLLLLIVHLEGWLSLIVGGALFVLFYLFLILFTQTVDLVDIRNLKRILGSMGPLTPFFNVFLRFFERVLKKDR
jgi:stage V sporulation protein B